MKMTETQITDGPISILATSQLARKKEMEKIRNMRFSRIFMASVKFTLEDIAFSKMR